MGLEVDFSKVQERLQEIGKKAGKEVSDKALKEGGGVMLEALKEEVRVNVYDTGELYNSLELGVIKGSDTNRKIEIGSQSNDREIIARNYYNEYGNSNMIGKKQNKKAFEDSKIKANEAIKESLKENLLK
ncbi:HK97 gp10 family phage protein [Clostridioides difficile]|nr:HK97 gp10 family phage protein [Clostridioides difficile]